MIMKLKTLLFLLAVFSWSGKVLAADLPDFCCCQKSDSGYNCNQVNAYYNGSPVCTQPVFAQSPGVSACFCQKPECDCVYAGKKGNEISSIVIGTGPDQIKEEDCAGRKKANPEYISCGIGIGSPQKIEGVEKSQCSVEKLSATQGKVQGCVWNYDAKSSTGSTQSGYVVFPVQANGTCKNVGNYTGLKSDVTQLQKDAANLNQLKFKSPQEFIGQAIKVMLSFIGSIALILYIYAGFNWMIARGESEKISQSKNMILWTTLSVFMMLASYILVQYLFKLF